MSKDQATGTNNNSSSVNIQRTAINTSKNPGTLYNAFRDIVAEQLDLGSVDNLPNSGNPLRCVLKSGTKDQSCNLLQLTHMPQDLRLSVLLKLTLTDGIASVIEYPRPINEYTRFLYYSYVHTEKRLHEEAEKVQKSTKSPCHTTDATHIITGISYGIDAVVVLQLPPDVNLIASIDCLLGDIRTALNDERKDLRLTTQEEALLEKIDNTMIYSNIPYLTKLNTIYAFYLYINENKKRTINNAILYTLQPIKSILHQYKGFGINFISLSSTINDEVEYYLIYLSNTVKSIKYYLDSNMTGLLPEQLEGQLRGKQLPWLKLDEMYGQIVNRLQKWVLDMRKNRSGISKNDQLFHHKDHVQFDTYAKNLQEKLIDFKNKNFLINDWKTQGFIYCNAVELNLSKNNYEQTVICKKRMNDRDNRILCTSDNLNKRNQSKLNSLRHQLVKEREANPTLALTYADFSYSSFEPNEMKILTLSKKNNKENINKKTPFSSSIKKKILTSQSSLSVPITNENINILLLGESGVGKSTFINALVNYLTFKTFEQAQSKEAVVLIPVSFTLTTGHNFEEHTVKFGDFDSSNNEDFDHPGESVTQHCKSYEFDLNLEDRKKLFIIDTPGFGDTRGIDQDDLNMQDILDYINNLSHVNAVCFLLKPNASQLNKFFQICLTQLLDHLGPDACQNIIFCFTNARTTFYSPGDTAPLLKAMLKSFPENTISFKKENTFCFDNESFRYLVALQNDIQFDTDETKEYEMSWSTSVKESNRFIDYICNELPACHLYDERQSIKHAEVTIVHMIRPILEAMRNTLRNLILCKMNTSNKSIQMCPKPLHRPATICILCKPYPIEIGNFWIARETPHEFLKKCLVCSCSIDKHIPINYVLKYEYSNSPTNYDQNEMEDIVHQFCVAGVDFDYFLLHVARSLKKEFFGNGLDQIIREETNLHKHQQPNHLNDHLVEHLTAVKYKYEERIEKLKSKRQQIELPSIYQWIRTICKDPMIQEQLEAITKTQKMMTEPYQVSQD